jgi:hypothetical protein
MPTEINKNMKRKALRLYLIGSLLLLLCACNKSELEDSNQTNVVNITVKGSTTGDLEFIYNDTVIATWLGPNQNPGFIKLISVDSKSEEVKIREKGTSNILGTITILPSPFNQSFNVYYDGNTIYNNAVSYHIKGYALTGELEVLLDENVVLTGTGAITGDINIGIEKGQTRQIQVRQKGETMALITKTINSSPDTQSLAFFFDGASIVDNIQLNPPLNSENMAISAKFESTLPDIFKGVDVDIVFYIRTISTYETVLTSPEIRLTLPADGSFSPTIDLPPLPNTTDYEYNFDIYEKGTSTVPYNTSSLSALYPVKPNLGLRGQGFSFEAGSTKLYIIKDVMSKIYAPAAKRATYFYGNVTDLSEYFKQ